MSRYHTRRLGWVILAMVMLGLVGGGHTALAQKQRLEGSIDETVTGPAGKASARVQGSRTMTGNTATSEGAITGAHGRAITATGSSEIQGNTATGAGTVTGPRGQTTRLTGSATKQGNTVNATGMATGPQGKTATAEGEATKVGNTVSGSGTVTGPRGQDVTVSGSGSQSAAAVTVDAPKGTSTATWDTDSVTATGAHGRSRTAPRGSGLRR
jgi:hypothetical protein